MSLHLWCLLQVLVSLKTFIFGWKLLPSLMNHLTAKGRSPKIHTPPVTQNRVPVYIDSYKSFQQQAVSRLE